MPVLNIFLIIGFVALVISFFIQGRSAIWGGATAGLIIGIILGIIKGDFSDILRATLIGADVGLVATILGVISDRMKRSY